MSSRLSNVADCVLENLKTKFELNCAFKPTAFIEFLDVNKNRQLENMLMAIHESSVIMSNHLSELAVNVEFNHEECCYGDTCPDEDEIPDEDCEIVPIGDVVKTPKKRRQMSLQNLRNLKNYLANFEYEIGYCMDGLKSVVPDFDNESVDEDDNDLFRNADGNGDGGGDLNDGGGDLNGGDVDGGNGGDGGHGGDGGNGGDGGDVNGDVNMHDNHIKLKNALKSMKDVIDNISKCTDTIENWISIRRSAHSGMDF